MRYRPQCWLVALTAFLLGGCLSHEMRIIVKQDGSIQTSVTSSGSKEDLKDGIVIRIPEGAQVKTWEDDAFHQQVTKHYAPKESLPSLLQVPKHLKEGTLGTPPKVRIIKDKDKLTFRFTMTAGRVYHPIEWTLPRFVDNDIYRKYRSDGFSELDEAEQKNILPRYARAAVEHMVRMHIQAIRKVIKKADKQAFNRYRKNLEDFKKHLDEVFADHLHPVKDTPWWEDQTQSLLVGISERLHAYLAESFPDAKHALAASRKTLERETALVMLAEDLRDENFEIYVEMPGNIARTNGDKEGRIIHWTLPGRVLWQRAYTMDATAESTRLLAKLPKEITRLLNEEGKKTLNALGDIDQFNTIGCDPFDKQITWFSSPQAFLVSIHAKTGDVILHRLMIQNVNEKELVLHDVAFSKEMIWAATDQGLFGMDRRLGHWYRYALARTTIQVSVKKLRIEGDRLLVETDTPEKQVYIFDLVRRIWLGSATE